MTGSGFFSLTPTPTLAPIKSRLSTSVAEPEQKRRLEPPLLGWSPSGFLVGRSREPKPPLFTAAPAASFWQAKKESHVVVTKHDLRAIYNGKCDLKKT